MLNGINTTIISPRRWGKSSLVEKVINNVNKKNKEVKTVIIDLFSVSNEAEFLEAFARETIKASSSKWQEWMSRGSQNFRQRMTNFSGKNLKTAQIYRKASINIWRWHACSTVMRPSQF